MRIGQHLKGTVNDGLIMKPMKTDSFVMDVHVDSDFLGIHGKEERADPDNARSRTGHVILLNGCPVMWSSFLQQTTSVSTMMAEHCALSAAMREVTPLRSLVRTVAKGVGLDDKCVTTFKVNVWEDNVGALTLANLDPGQDTPRSKWCDSKVHWFRSHLNSNIKVLKIDTKLQMADIFTKSGTRESFLRIRKLLCGW